MPCLPCVAQIPTVATRADLEGGCFGLFVTCFRWLDCEGCCALVTLCCQKQQHAILNTKNPCQQDWYLIMTRVHNILAVVRSSRASARKVIENNGDRHGPAVRGQAANRRPSTTITSCLVFGRKHPWNAADSPFLPPDGCLILSDSSPVFITCIPRQTGSATKAPPDVKRGSLTRNSTPVYLR